PIHPEPSRLASSGTDAWGLWGFPAGDRPPAPASFAAATLTEARRRLRAARPIVDTEAQWRRLQRRRDRAAPMRVGASRWQAFESGSREVRAESPQDTYLVKVALRAADMRLIIDGRTVHDGPATAGMVHVTGPGADARCLFRGPCDTLHLHVPD